jgi:hypothetical protein
MEVSSLEEITPALLLKWNTMLHDADAATGTVKESASSPRVPWPCGRDPLLGIRRHG